MLLAVLAAAASALDPVAAASPAIDRANNSWLADMQSGNADGLTEAYAEDGLFILPDGKTIMGRKAVRDFYAARAASKVSIIGGAIHSLGRSAAGPDLVVEWGKGDLRLRRPDGAVQVRGGPYLTVWRRQPDGGWRIVRNLVF